MRQSSKYKAKVLTVASVAVMAAVLGTATTSFGARTTPTPPVPVTLPSKVKAAVFATTTTTTAPPTTYCYNGISYGDEDEPDLQLSNDFPGQAKIFSSIDGTCTGEVLKTVKVVSAGDEDSALTQCGPTSSGANRLTDLWPTAPEGLWKCVENDEPPTQDCYEGKLIDGEPEKKPDLLVTLEPGDGQNGEAKIFSSIDGTCTGEVLDTVGLVFATGETEASVLCGNPYTFSVSDSWLSAPPNLWACLIPV